MRKLKNTFDEIKTSQPWWEQIVGTFENDPIYDEAMKLGLTIVTVDPVFAAYPVPLLGCT